MEDTFRLKLEVSDRRYQLSARLSPAGDFKGVRLTPEEPTQEQPVVLECVDPDRGVTCTCESFRDHLSCQHLRLLLANWSLMQLLFCNDQGPLTEEQIPKEPGL